MPSKPNSTQRQLLPSAWKSGDEAIYTEGDEQLLAGTVVKGSGLRGRVTLDAFRIFRGRRAWYVSGSLPTATGGALVFEDELRQLNGRRKVDKAFLAFMDRLLQPGIFQTPPYKSLIDVRDLSSIEPIELEVLDKTFNPGWREMEKSRHQVDRWEGSP